jgi:hypothetical protein
MRDHRHPLRRGLVQGYVGGDDRDHGVHRRSRNEVAAGRGRWRRLDRRPQVGELVAESVPRAGQVAVGVDRGAGRVHDHQRADRRTVVEPDARRPDAAFQ